METTIVIQNKISSKLAVIGIVGMVIGAVSMGNTDEYMTSTQSLGFAIVVASASIFGYWLGNIYNIYLEEQ